MLKNHRILVIFRNSEFWLAWPTLLAAIAITFYLYCMGYGSWIRPLNIPIVGAILLFLGFTIFLVRFFKRFMRLRSPGQTGTGLLPPSTILCALSFSGLALLISAFFGAEILLWRTTAVRNAGDYLVHELAIRKENTGAYPTNPRDLQAYSDLRNRYSFYFGEQQPDGSIQWDVSDVGNADISVFVTLTCFCCVVPIEKRSLISFSSFYVWRYRSDAPRWVKTKLHWSLLGAYMDD